MLPAATISALKLEVRESQETNDHEVRIMVDGADWLGTDSLGLDPPELQEELARTLPVEDLLVGRCDCGVVGCDDVWVNAARNGLQVEWIGGPTSKVTFDADQYDREVRRFIHDHSWEPLGRRVERLVKDLFSQVVLDGHQFTWASTRIRPAQVQLAFWNGEHQKLVAFGWDGVSEESALSQARVLLKELADEGP